MSTRDPAIEAVSNLGRAAIDLQVENDRLRSALSEIRKLHAPTETTTTREEALTICALCEDYWPCRSERLAAEALEQP